VKNNLLIACLLLLSCKKDIPNPITDTPPASFSAVFDDFWNDMNADYLYWDIDTTDWNRVHAQYKPLFDKLNLSIGADQLKSVAYFRQITDGLIDHHYLLSFSNHLLADSAINPADDRLLKEAGFRYPYSYLASDGHYLDSGALYGSANQVSAITGTIRGHILFLGFSWFSLYSTFHSSAPNAVQPLLTWFFSRLQDASIKGVLLDLRDNPGGDIVDLNFLGGQFTGAPLHFGYTRYKSGNGRLDYTPWIDANILPAAGARTIGVPLVILADRYTASAAEILLMSLHTLSNCKVVGETTFGATGPLTEKAVYNDGSFDVSGFLSVKTSSSEFKYIDGKIYEGQGFPPDYPIPYSAAAIGNGKDPQMDKALTLFP
jgi:hypothetical protein